MNDIYLVEIRLGRTKWRVRQEVTSIARAFNIEPFMERHPHVTLYGPMELQDGVSPRQILDIIGEIASRYDPVPFTLDRFELREGMHGSVIAYSVRPSDSLKKMTAEIAASLFPMTRSHNAWDGQPGQKWYHVTIANHLDRAKASETFLALPGPDSTGIRFSQARGFLSRLFQHIRTFMASGDARLIRPLLLDETGLRITLMHGEEILAEYDLLKKCWIYDDHRHDSNGWQETLARFRKYAGFECTGTRPVDPDDIFLIADLHFGHANIIRYCSRPFLVSDPGEMDRVLIGNWNAVVSPGVPVYHLGDLRYGRTAPAAGEYCRQLSGKITFINGNHDEPEAGARSMEIIDYRGTRYCLVHDPADTPAAFDGWIIHGHHHNNDLLHYPFIDFTHRRINVSAEVVGYVPVSLRDISHLIEYRKEAGNTRPVLLNYSYTE